MFDERMVIPFEPLRERLLRLDALRRGTYLQKVRRRYLAWAAGRIPLAALCSDAGDALEDYSAETLDALFAAGTNRAEPARWVLDDYHEAITRAGMGLRDLIDDPAARHEVAQTLQERLLRAEGHLRFVLNADPWIRPRP